MNLLKVLPVLFIIFSACRSGSHDIDGYMAYYNKLQAQNEILVHKVNSSTEIDTLLSLIDHINSSVEEEIEAEWSRAFEKGITALYTINVYAGAALNRRLQNHRCANNSLLKPYDLQDQYWLENYTTKFTPVLLLIMLEHLKKDLLLTAMIDPKCFIIEEGTTLNTIVAEYDNILMNEYNAATPADAYILFAKDLDSMVENNGVIYLSENISAFMEEVPKYDISKEIWEIDANKRKIKYIRTSGKYMDLLRREGEKLEFIADYTKAIISAGDISPPVRSGFVKQADRLDFKNKNHRLIFTIHNITLYHLSVNSNNVPAPY